MGSGLRLEGLARSHTAPAREVRQAKALLWAAAEGTAAVGRARAANQGSMMRPARASKPDGYLLGSYRIATAPEPNSSRLTSFKSSIAPRTTSARGPRAWDAPRSLSAVHSGATHKKESLLARYCKRG